jgi:uncharacterized membrane protein YcaP (DUF421 family)
MHASMWSNMFVPAVPLLEKIIRPILVYIFLVVALRLAGKRELAQLNPFDLVVLLTLANTVQNAIIGDDNSVSGGLVGAATLLIVNYFVVRFLFSHRKVDRLVEGGEAVLIQNGKIVPRGMKAELITKEELEEAAHRQGFASLSEVERAVLEPGGAIAFIAKKPSPEELRHRDLVSRLDQIAGEVARLGPPRPQQA